MHMYFIAVVLPAHLNEKVLKLKLWMQEQYGCKVALKSPAHITLIPPFWLHSSLVEKLLANTDTIAQSSLPFTIITHNFSSFKPRTIFIAVQPNEYLNELKNRTGTLFAVQQDLKIKVDHRPFHPHITIATRDIHKKAFYEAWPVLAQKTFIEEWTADSIFILKHNTQNWDIYHTAPFATTAIHP